MGKQAIPLFLIGCILARLTLRERPWIPGRAGGCSGLITVGDYLNQTVARLLIFVVVVVLPLFLALLVLQHRNRSSSG